MSDAKGYEPEENQEEEAPVMEFTENADGAGLSVEEAKQRQEQQAKIRDDVTSFSARLSRSTAKGHSSNCATQTEMETSGSRDGV